MQDSSTYTENASTTEKQENREKLHRHRGIKDFL